MTRTTHTLARIPVKELALTMFLGAAALLSVGKGLASEPKVVQVSFAGLLEEMADSTSAARWPRPEFTLKQASSYDRRSKTPGNEDWFANNDWSNFVRSEIVRTPEGERTEYVMLDEAGPGAIVRFWSTIGGTADVGTLRIYIDGASTPALEGKPDEIIGGQKYFPRPSRRSEIAEGTSTRPSLMPSTSKSPMTVLFQIRRRIRKQHASGTTLTTARTPRELACSRSH